MGECILEISRESQFSGSAFSVGVMLDSCAIGSLKSGDSLRVSVPLGQHHLDFCKYGRVVTSFPFAIIDGQQHAFFTVKINFSGGVSVSGSQKITARKGKPKGCLTALLCVICAFLLLGIVASFFGTSPKKVSDTNNSEEVPSSTIKAPAEEKHEASSSVSEPSVFSVGEEVELRGVHVTLVDVSENLGANYINPTDGNVFILCEFEIENDSDQDIAVSSLLSFEAYVDSYTAQMSLSALMTTDKMQLDGSIASGKKMNGVIGYEAKKDWSEIEIRFSPSFLGKEIVFQYNK